VDRLVGKERAGSFGEKQAAKDALAKLRRFAEPARERAAARLERGQR
jgi:hypothetical protein